MGAAGGGRWRWRFGKIQKRGSTLSDSSPLYSVQSLASFHLIVVVPGHVRIHTRNRLASLLLRRKVGDAANACNDDAVAEGAQGQRRQIFAVFVARYNRTPRLVGAAMCTSLIASRRAQSRADWEGSVRTCGYGCRCRCRCKGRLRLHWLPLATADVKLCGLHAIGQSGGAAEGDRGNSGATGD